MHEVWELKYSLSLQKLTKRISSSRSVSLSPRAGREFVNEDRSFFCSELVAKMYKVLGILATEMSSGGFYPSDFE